MAKVDGNAKRRLSLTAGVPMTLEFVNGIQKLSLANMGTGKVAYKIDADITNVNDDAANYIDDNLPVVDISKGTIFKTLSLISENNTDVQWDMP